jgi:hypothetical protein
MFMFDAISSKSVDKFLRWVSANNKGPSFPLPKGIKQRPPREWPNEAGYQPIRQSAAPVARPAAYGLTLSEGSHSTVPGHQAELDWNDLRKR